MRTQRILIQIHTPLDIQDQAEVRGVILVRVVKTKTVMESVNLIKKAKEERSM